MYTVTSIGPATVVAVVNGALVYVTAPACVVSSLSAHGSPLPPASAITSAGSPVLHWSVPALHGLRASDHASVPVPDARAGVGTCGGPAGAASRAASIHRFAPSSNTCSGVVVWSIPSWIPFSQRSNHASWSCWKVSPSVVGLWNHGPTTSW